MKYKYTAGPEINNNLAKLSEMKDWKLQYDEILQQHYYINVKTNVITFNASNEVKKRSLLCRITSRKKSFSSCFQTISNKSTKSSKSNKSSVSTESKTIVNNQTASYTDNEYKPDIFYDDEYLLSNNNNFKNFAGTALDQAASIYSDSESIITYYSNLNNDYYNDYENNNSIKTTMGNTYMLDKEKERIELRSLLLKQFEV